MSRPEKPDPPNTVRVSGGDFQSTLERLSAEGKVIASFSVGRTPSEWVISFYQPVAALEQRDLFAPALPTKPLPTHSSEPHGEVSPEPPMD